MQKFLAFLNKHAVTFNVLSIAFWVYISYTAYIGMNANKTFEGKKYFFVVPAIFILLSSFNLYMAIQRKKRT